jgi:hypothetical protein
VHHHDLCGRRDRESVFSGDALAQSTSTATPNSTVSPLPYTNPTMDSPHIEERPHKKRRFFAENSSPVHTAPVRHPSPPPPVASPDPTPTSIASPIGVQSDNAAVQDGGGHGGGLEGGLEGFDVGLLQAVVGDLESSVLQKLRHVSGNDVQRGMQPRLIFHTIC